MSARAGRRGLARGRSDAGRSAEAGGHVAGRSSSHREAARSRACRALAFVVAVVVAAALGAGAEQAKRPGVVRAVVAGSVQSIVMDDGSPGLGGDSSSAAPPSAFEDEVLSLKGRAEVRVDEGSGIVGFASPGAAAEAFASVAGELEDRGWVGVAGGADAAGSFVKADGVYRWAHVACMQMGESTSVVVQCATTDERS